MGLFFLCSQQALLFAVSNYITRNDKLQQLLEDLSSYITSFKTYTTPNSKENCQILENKVIGFRDKLNYDIRPGLTSITENEKLEIYYKDILMRNLDIALICEWALVAPPIRFPLNKENQLNFGFDLSNKVKLHVKHLKQNKAHYVEARMKLIKAFHSHTADTYDVYNDLGMGVGAPNHKVEAYVEDNLEKTSNEDKEGKDNKVIKFYPSHNLTVKYYKPDNEYRGIYTNKREREKDERDFFIRAELYVKKEQRKIEFEIETIIKVWEELAEKLLKPIDKFQELSNPKFSEGKVVFSSADQDSEKFQNERSEFLSSDFELIQFYVEKNGVGVRDVDWYDLTNMLRDYIVKPTGEICSSYEEYSFKEFQTQPQVVKDFFKTILGVDE